MNELLHTKLRQVIDQQAAEIEWLRQAVGLATTAKPDLEMNVNDPIGMMHEVVAEIDRLKELLEAYRAWAESADRMVDDMTFGNPDELSRAKNASRNKAARARVRELEGK